MKKSNLNSVVRIVSMSLGVIALICIFISIFYKSGNNIFLNVGLLCVCAAGLIPLLLRKKNKGE